MRILFLTQYFPPEVGAPQNRLFELAQRLTAKGVEIEVLTAMPNYPRMVIHEEYQGKKYVKEELDGLTVHRATIYVSQKRGIISRLRNYFSFVRSSYKVGKRLDNFDFIFCESPPLFLGYSAMKLARKLKARLIFNVSDLWPESAEKMGMVSNKFLLNRAYKLEERCYRNSVLVTGQTQGIVKSINDRFPEIRTFWLPNGVDLSYYNPEKHTNSVFRKTHGLEDKFIFLYAGIIGHAQGLEVLLEAASQLKLDSEIHFVLLGAGPEKEKLMVMANELELKNVSFMEPVTKDEMPDIVASSNVSVVPLRKLDLFKGAIPSKIFENLAMEKPILLGVDGEARDLFVEEGKCALYFEPENAAELAIQAKRIKSDPELYGSLSENARKYVSERFDRNIIAEKFWQELNTLET